jgi:choline dehydrogenase-like flavoprotein
LTRDTSLLVVETEQAPNRNSRIGLSTERDALGQPRARVDWQLSEQDRTTMLSALRTFAAQLWVSHRVRIWLPEAMENPLERWGFNLVDVSHHIGTTRMSEDSTRGVVDANCKVHGIDNLFIAGSSVFPTSGHVNPTMTIVSLAVRLAEHLRQRALG